MDTAMAWIRLGAGLAAAVPAFQASAARQRIECPALLPATAVKIVDAPPGWTPFTPSLVRLHAAGALAGPPESMAILKGEMYQKGKDKEINVFDLDERPSEKWMQCSYGSGNEVTLSRRLPDDTASCTVTYTKTKPYGEVVIDIFCR